MNVGVVPLLTGDFRFTLWIIHETRKKAHGHNSAKKYQEIILINITCVFNISGIIIKSDKLKAKATYYSNRTLVYLY